MEKDNKTIKEKAKNIKENVKRGIDETKVKAHLAKEDIKDEAKKIKNKVSNKIAEEKSKHKKIA